MKHQPFGRKVYLFLLLLFPLLLQGQTYKYYFGNIHAHTAFSDGNKDHDVATPGDSYAFAKKSKHFDFLGISEHNHSQAGMHLASYKQGLDQANQANTDGKFVCLYGMEFGVISKGGHVVIYGVDSLVGWEAGNFDIFVKKSDYVSLWNMLVKRPNIFVTLAHPKATDFSDLLHHPFNETADSVIRGVAVRSGPAFSEKTDDSDRPKATYYKYYREMLAAGYKVGPTVDHDTHNTVFGRSTMGRTVVLSQELSRDSIIAAYRAMRFYASDDWNAKVNFTVNGHPMGSTVEISSNATIKVTVSDPDTADKVASIKLFFGQPGSGELAKELASALNKSTLTFKHVLENEDSFYYFVEITQKDGDKIYTAPIWITAPE